MGYLDFSTASSDEAVSIVSPFIRKNSNAAPFLASCLLGANGPAAEKKILQM